MALEAGNVFASASKIGNYGCVIHLVLNIDETNSRDHLISIHIFIFENQEH